MRIVVDKSDDNVPRLVPVCIPNPPPRAEHASIIRLGCCAEPNPTGSGPGPLLIPAPTFRPFRDTAAKAIVLFNLLIEYMNIHAAQFFHATRPFTFIVHRRALLSHIPRVQQACAPFHSVIGAAGAPPMVPWSAWGVPITRWFESDQASIRWITTTAGQRAVTMEDRSPTPIIVHDFNPYAVRAALAREASQGWTQECEKSRVLPNGNRQTIKVEEDVIPAGSVFREDVRSALPYIETVTQTRYGYEGVLIDEERILGLVVCSLPFLCHHVLMRQYVSQTSKDDEIEICSFDVHILG